MDSITIAGPPAVKINNYTKPGRSRLKMLLIASAALLLLSVLIVIVVAVVKNHKPEEVELCETPECMRTARAVLLCMNHTADPCQDFHQFACGNFYKFRRMKEGDEDNNWFDYDDENIDNIIKDTLNNIAPNPEDKYSMNLKLLIESCLDTDTLKKLHLEPFVNVLHSVGLPATVPDQSTGKTVDISKAIALAQKVLGLNIFFRFTFYDKGKFLALNAPITASTLQSTSDRLRQASVRYIVSVIRLLRQSNTTAEWQSVEHDETTAHKILFMNERIREVIDKCSKLETYSITTVQEVHTSFLKSSKKKMDFDRYLMVLLEGTTDEISMTNRVVTLFHPEYFTMLSKFLAASETLDIQRYIWWRVVENMASYAAPVMGELTQKYESQAFGKEGKPSRIMKCLKDVKALVQIWVAHEVVRQRMNPNTQASIKEMTASIRTSFEDVITESQWLKDRSKNFTLDKIQAINFTIGYPDWLLKYAQLDRIYEKVKITKGQYLRNAVSIQSVTMNNMLISVAEELPYIFHERSWDIKDILDKVSSFDHQLTTVAMPIVRTMFPYHGHRLESFNYGALGCLIGSRMMFGFNKNGMRFDKLGLVKFILLEEDVAKYDERVQCFERGYGQYSNYKKDDLKKTLEKYLEFDSGVRLSFRAYLKFLKQHGPEKKMPGLEQYSSEQLFFLAVGNIYCEAVIGGDVNHRQQGYFSLLRDQVIGTMSNSEDFARVWRCPKDSPMNPSNKCILW